MPGPKRFPTTLNQSRVASDLQWLLRANNLVTPPQSLVYETLSEHQKTLRNAITTANDLPTHLKSGPQILGHYAEQLMAWAINHHPQYQLLANNVQIRDQRGTLGELDFVVKTPSAIEHWELAVKFYLRTGHTEGLKDYVGPNRRDRLDLKSSHMWSKQCPIATTSACSDRLQQLNIPPPTRSLWCLIGWLFEPFDLFNEKTNSSDGWWLPLSSLDAIKSDSMVYCVLPRLEWLSPLEHLGPEHTQLMLHHHQLRDWLNHRFAQNDGPTLIARLIESKSGYDEMDRGFVAPNTWQNGEARPGFG